MAQDLAQWKNGLALGTSDGSVDGIKLG